MLTLIYLAMYLVFFIVGGVVMSLIATIFTRDLKLGTKVGIWITQVVYLCYFIHLLVTVNPMGIVLQ